jgi:hypothetical protein
MPIENVIEVTKDMRPMPHDRDVNITIQYFDGCPHWKLADQRVQAVLKRLDMRDVKLAYQLIDSPEEAERERFRGSPTILVNGQDPFAREDQPFGLSCRVYETEDGSQGAPTETQLQRLFEPLLSA